MEIQMADKTTGTRNLILHVGMLACMVSASHSLQKAVFAFMSICYSVAYGVSVWRERKDD